MDMGNDWVSFQARFSGTPRRIHFPAAAVLAVYARENGQGMMFGEAEALPEEGAEQQQTLTSVPSLESSSEPSSEQGGSEAPTEKPRSRSHLKVVK
jgi:stringent starvation protein B